MSGPSRGGIFISYRRADAAAMAGRLYDLLVDHFGDDQIFMDVDTIGAGVDFAGAVAQAVSTCQAVLVLIGPQWLADADQQGRRRLDDPTDLVRLEIEAAFESGVRVIPILVKGAMPPVHDELPKSLARLSSLNAVVVRNEYLSTDVQRLAVEVERLSAGAEGIAAGAPDGEGSKSREAPVPARSSFRTDSTLEKGLGKSIRSLWSEASKARQPVSDHSASGSDSSTLSVFLCHSSSDKPAVRTLHAQLLGDGLAPWLDELDILPGQDWDGEIRKAIRRCHIVLVCLSGASINKVGYIQKEIRQVLDVADEQPEGTIFLIPVRLEECEVPDRLSRWQWVDLFEERGYGRLMLALAARRRDLSERRA